MEAKAKRTLVKSAPELWELADDIGRMEAWLADVAGKRDPVAVRVTERRPERSLAWRAADDRAVAVALTMAESGFGTSVSIVARHPRVEACTAEAALERFLDELGSPERRPFERG